MGAACAPGCALYVDGGRGHIELVGVGVNGVGGDIVRLHHVQAIGTVALQGERHAGLTDIVGALAHAQWLASLGVAAYHAAGDGHQRVVVEHEVGHFAVEGEPLTYA